MNALLKFLEEPNNTIAILTTNSAERVLPTIVSRCQIINFKNPNPDEFMNIALTSGMNDIDSYIISNIKPDINMFATSEEEEYQLALNGAKYFIENYDNLYSVLYYFQREILLTDSSKNAKIVSYLLEILGLFFKDVSREFDSEYGWYSKLVKKFNKKDYSRIILLLVEAKDKCKLGIFNTSLILDQLMYQIIMEEKND